MHAGPLYAAVDLGSNSFHLLLARARGARSQQVDIVYRSREKVRLANGFDTHMNLSEAAIERGLSCLYEFSDYLKNIPAEHIKAVATASLRKARNQTYVLQRFSDALGFPLEVISGEQEAALIYQGATWGQQPESRQLVIDIGGASTEVIAGQGQQANILNSFDMGCVIYQQHYFGDGKITQSHCNSAIAAAQQQIRASADAYRAHQWKLTMGASGTFKALHEILLARGQKPSITATFLEQILTEAIALGQVSHLKFKGLREDRRSVFMGGLCILVGLYRALQIEHAHIATGALREGLLRSLVHEQTQRTAS